MLNAIAGAVTEVLKNAEIPAVCRFADSAIDRHGEARVVVGVLSGENKSGGFGGYLGTRRDPGLGETPIYGYKLDAVIGLTIFAAENEGAARCGEVFSQVSEALLHLPKGLRARSLKCSAAEPDLKTGMFKCEAQLLVSAHFVCAVDEEAGEFLDFELIGVVKNGL